jgi:hypothetical protein
MLTFCFLSNLYKNKNKVKELYTPILKIKELYTILIFSNNIVTTKQALVKLMHTKGTLYSTNFTAHLIV